MRAIAIAIVLVALAALGCRRTEASAAQATTAAPPARSVVDDLAMLATSAPRGDDVPSDVDAAIDRLLASPRLAHDVAPEVLLHGPPAPPMFMDPYFLRSTRAKAGEVVYYLRRPCAVADAVSVRPWWDQAHPVLVCPDSYRPERKKDPHGFYCGGELMKPNPREPDTQFCGCGSGLMHCVRDLKDKEALLASAERETVDTIAHVVANDQPLVNLYSMNETVRDRRAEFLDARARVLSGQIAELPDLAAWPEEGRLAPRSEGYPGQHAGILTTPHVVRMESTPRASMRRAYELLWCKPPESIGVDAEQVFALGVTDLREGDGWKKLAAMPICTDCHARLDYGMRFFGGLLDVRRATDFVASEPRPATSHLFVGDIHDDRGQAAATPHAFAELATRQPEFGRCMTERVLEHVFQRAFSPSAWDAVFAAFTAQGTFRAMMRAALRAYVAESQAPSRPAPLLAVTAAPPGDEVTVPPPLRAVIDDSCGSCHSSPPYDLTAPRLPAATLHKMLRHVSSGRMPKGVFAPDTRRKLASGLVDLLWSDPGEREEARSYFVDLGRGLPVHRYSAIVNAVDAAGGAARAHERNAVRLPGMSGAVDLNAGLGAAMAAQALRRCRATTDRAARTACLEQATDPALAVKGRLPVQLSAVTP